MDASTNTITVTLVKLKLTQLGDFFSFLALTSMANNLRGKCLKKYFKPIQSDYLG